MLKSSIMRPNTALVNTASNKQVTINHMASIDSQFMDSIKLEEYKKQMHNKRTSLSQKKVQKLFNRPNSNNQALIAHKFDPFHKKRDTSLDVNKNELQFQHTETQENLKALSTIGIQKVIDVKMLERREQEEEEKIRLKKEEEKEEEERKKLADEKLKKYKNDTIQNEEKYKNYQKKMNEELQFHSLKSNIAEEEFKNMEKEIKNIKENESILMPDKTKLKPKQFRSMFQNAQVVGNLSYVGDDEENKQIGAQYDKSGEIIPSSIVGYPKWYQNQEKRKNGQQVTQDQETTLLGSKKPKQRPLSSCHIYSPRSLVPNSQRSQQQQHQDNNNKSMQQLESRRSNQPKIITLKGTNKFQINMKTFEKNQQRKKDGTLKQMKDIEKNNPKPPTYSLPSQKQKTFEYQEDIGEQIINGIIEEKDYEEYMQTLQEDELAKNIVDVQYRLQQNKLRNKQYNKGVCSYLTKGEALYLTKEQRILQKFENEQRRMKNFIQKAALKLKRDEQQSIYIQSNNFRSKLETATALEVIQPDIIKYGEMRYWQCKLRDYRTEDEKYDINNKDAVQLEVIRRPKSSLIKSRAEGLPPFTTFTSGQFFQAKLQEGKEKLAKISHLDDREMELLEIKGENKFKIERNNLVRGENHELLNRLTSIQMTPEEIQLYLQQNQNTTDQSFRSKHQQLLSQLTKTLSGGSKQKAPQTHSFNQISSQQQQEQQQQQQQFLSKQSMNSQDQLQQLQKSQVSFNIQDQELISSQEMQNLNRYQKFDLENKLKEQQKQQQQDNNNNSSKKKKTTYKIKRKIPNNPDNENIEYEDVLYSNWIKEEIRGNNGQTAQKIQLKV